MNLSLLFNANHLLQIGGLWLIATFIFSEVGLFLGFFLPGDTLLITAGIFAKEGKLSLSIALIVIALAAITGDNFAYFIGRKLGPKVFTKPDSLLLRKDHIQQAEKFYLKYGPKTVLVAHFFPVIRSFSPLLAGVGKMNYKKYFIYDFIGDILWSFIVTLLGYYVASRIPNIDHYILIVLVGVVLISLIPTFYHLIRLIRKKRATKSSSNTDQ